jgi:hypothetical protein
MSREEIGPRQCSQWVPEAVIGSLRQPNARSLFADAGSRTTGVN